MNILVLNGPNFDLLGFREPIIYGNKTQKQIFDEIVDFSQRFLVDKDINLELQQSNSEGELIDILHLANSQFDGVIFNPAAYTHTSVAISDAIRSIDIPVVEVHLTNVFSRESYRQQMLTTSSCIGQICGFRDDSYVAGLLVLVRYIEKIQKGN